MVEYDDPIIIGFIKSDRRDAFVRRIHLEAQSVGGYDVYQSLMLSNILISIHFNCAVNCATALLQGETGLKLDINAIDPCHGLAPLHLFSDEPGLTDLFLTYGARTDIRCKGGLPLDCAIGHLRDQCQCYHDWSTRQSIYLTIVFMCGRHYLASVLECIRMIFRATKEVEKQIYHYVKDGKVFEIAALLTVAREEVTSPSLFKGLCDPALNGSMSLRQLVLSEIVSLMAAQITSVSTSEEVHDELNNKLETMMSMLSMIEVFERVGDKIELYRRYLTKCSEELWTAQMACLLITEGLAEYKDFEVKSGDGPISSNVVSDFKGFVSNIFEWKLYEGMCLESGTTKIYKQYDVDPTWIPRLSNQPPTLEAIPILDKEGDANASLPLKVSLEKLCHHPYLIDWTPKKSTFKLVCILCLLQLKESLESIRLVACKIDEIEAIGCNLARHGKLIELASLLMVAPEKLIVTASPGSKDLRSSAIRRCIMSDLQALLDLDVRLTGRSNNHKLVQKCKDEKETRKSALLLLEVIERAGNSINHYLQSDAYNDGRRSRLEIAGEIQNLLEKSGFAMKPKDADLNDIKCFSPTLDPVDSTSLPSAMQPHQFSVAEHLFGMHRGLPRTPLLQASAAGSRTFHTMVQGNRKCCGPWVSSPKPKALKPAIPNVSRKSIGWFLSPRVSKVVKHL